MTISNDQINAVVARLAAAFPQTFVLEKHLAHRPLKIGIAADLRAALPELPSRVLARALAAYAKRCQWRAESPHLWRPNFPHLGGHGDQP